MKSIGKIGVLLISFFLVSSIFFFINIETYGIEGATRFRGLQLLFIIGIPWFVTYSKWANTNIWNRKTSKPNNTSDTSSDELVEPIDDNRDILSNINLPSLSGSNDDLKDALQKIEELKRQIESLEQSIKNNDTNSETESSELSEEDVKRWTKSEEELKAETGIGGSIGGVVIVLWILMIVILLFIIPLIT